MFAALLAPWSRQATGSSAACSRQLRVIALPRTYWLAFLQGRARLRNLPADATIVGAEPLGALIAFRVCSASYPPVPPQQPIPHVTAVVEIEGDR